MGSQTLDLATPRWWGKSAGWWLTVLASLLLLLHARAVAHETDDLFISLRYAHHLADGLGPVFNPGERIEGYTSPLWVFTLGLLAKGGAPLFPAARLLSLLAGVATLWLVRALARTWQWRGATLAIFFLALNPTFAVWTMAAMEMTLFSALLIAALCALGARRWWLSGLAFGLAILTRPEGVLWLGITLLWQLYRSRSDEDATWQDAAKVLVGASLLVLPHLAWRLAYYGRPLPNTFYAKVGLSAAMLQRGGDYLQAAVWDYRLTLTPLLLLALALPRSWRQGGALLLALLFAQIGYVVWVGGDWMVAYRFLVPAMPIAGLLVARMLHQGHDLLARHERPLLALVAIEVVMLLHLFTAADMRAHLLPDWFFIQQGVPDGKRIARVIDAHCEPTTSLAVFAAGSLPFHALDHYVIDMFGLVTPAVSQSSTAPMGGNMAGHDRFHAATVRAMRPDLYIFHHKLDDAPIKDEVGWREGGLGHLIRQFTDDPTFWQEHYTVNREISPGRYWNFVARHDAPCQWE